MCVLLVLIRKRVCWVVKKKAMDITFINIHVDDMFLTQKKKKWKNRLQKEMEFLLDYSVKPLLYYTLFKILLDTRLKLKVKSSHFFGPRFPGTKQYQWRYFIFKTNEDPQNMDLLFHFTAQISSHCIFILLKRNWDKKRARARK